MIRTRVPTNFPWAIGTKDTKSSRIFGNRKLALFKGKNGDMKAVDDKCPHRGASLSKGIRKNGCIECPYHGWKFDEDGKVIHIPTTENIPCNSDVNSFKVSEFHDIIWLESPYICPPIFPYLMTTEWNSVAGSSEVDGNWVDWITNSCDISHINYVHDFADENNGTIDEMNITEYTNSIVCEAYVKPKASNLLTKPLQVDRSKVICEFIYPNTTIITVKLIEPFEFITYTTVTPITKNKSRLSWSFSHNIKLGDTLLSSLLDNYFYSRMNKTISEDQNIISEIPEGHPFNINVPCDLFQIKVLKNLEKLVKDNEVNDFYLL